MSGNKKDIAVIDLFCGIGGLSHGFVREELEVVAGYDSDTSCKYAFETNNHACFCSKDVSELKGEILNELFGDKLNILIGCAPCLPFSSYSFKVKVKDEKKVNLLYTFSHLIEKTQPTIVSMENVPQLIDFDQSSIFQDFFNKLMSMGYFVHCQVVFCPDYGIPQTRKRLVLLAPKRGKIKLIDKSHGPDNYITVRDVIGQLAPVKTGEQDKDDPLHRARQLTALNLRRIQHTKEFGAIISTHS